MSKIEAVMIDIDGTTVDCEGRNRRVIETVARKYGGKIEPQDWLQLAGTGDKPIHKWLSAKFTAFTVPESVFIDEIKQGYLTDNFGVAARAGMIDVINHILDRKIKLGAVTNSPRDVAVSNLRMAAVDYLIPHIVSLTDVEQAGLRPKPSGDPYRLMARTLNVTPDGCLVLEDTDTGAKAGRKFGALVLQVVDDPAARSSHADFYAYDKNDLKDLVKALIP